MSELARLEMMIYKGFEAYAQGKCVSAIKSAFSEERKDATGKTEATFHAYRESENLYFVGSYDKVAKIIYTGRREVVPVNKRALKYRNGRYSMYSKPVPPDDFVSRAVARLGG